MPKYNSREGKWYPAKERVALKNIKDEKIVNPSEKGSRFEGEEVEPGADYIYEGVDRAAAFELFQQGVETLGQDFRSSTEFLQSIRNMGFNDIDSYLKFIGYDPDKSIEQYKEKSKVVNKNLNPPKVDGKQFTGGGIDTTGSSKPRHGGFGPQPKD